MSCTASNPVLDKLRKLTNNDVRRATDYLATIESPAFAEWYEDETGTPFDSEQITKDTVDAIKAFNSLKVINTGDFIQNIRTSRTGLFGNDIAKEDHAINILTTMFLKAEGAINKKIAEAKKKHEKKERTDVWVKQLLLGQLERHIVANKDTLTKDQIDYLNIIRYNLYDGGRYNNNELFELVVNSPEAMSLSKEFGLNKDEDYTDESDANEESEQGINDQDAIAALKTDWSELSDQRKDIDKNVSKDVKEWFNKLKRTKSNAYIDGNADFDTDTFSGIPESVPFATSFKIINNYANFTSVENFVDSLHKLAAQFKEGSHLETAARLLENPNNVQMRNRIYTQMKQSIWARNELAHREGKSNVIIKNRNSFPKLNLLNTILNSFDKFVINPTAVIEDTAILNELSKRVEAIPNIKRKDYRAKEVQKITESIYEIINKYNFGINREGLINYIYNHGINKEDNLKSVIKDLLEFNEAVANTSEIIARNNALEREYNTAEYRKTIDDPDYKVQPFDKQSLISIEGAGNRIADKIADRFKDYQLVDNEFNSINAENNLVSDILKNNYISRFFERIHDNNYNDNPQDNVELRDYFKSFLSIPAYRYSNILVEHTYEGVVVPGFLRLVNGEYQLTPYYREFGAELFNGIRNDVTGKAKSYKDINALEWDIVTLNEFANNGDRFEISKGVRRSRYFTPTPSDAPKTFLLTGYRLSLNGIMRNGAINRNHPIYQSFVNTFNKELATMAQAIDFLFETEDKDGIVVLGDKLKVKEEFSNLRESNAKLNYHYKKGRILDDNGVPTGNVFKFRALQIDPTTDSSNLNLDKVFGESLIQLLYGGSESKSFITRNENRELVINIDEDTMAKVYSYIDNYIKYRINEGVDTYLSKKQFVDRYKNASEAEYKNFIAEMVLNYEIQINNMNDMIFGDEAFYKDSRDTIKRNKEYQAGGLSYAAYGIYNTERKGDTIKIGNREIPITSSFKYITLEDVKNDGSVIKDLKKQLDIANVSSETREFILGQFAKNNAEITDAQSYITLDEFVRRMYLRGEYDNYKELIEALYDESKPIDSRMMRELSKFIQVQKNFYYDLEIDGNSNLANPIQIKNAEFVLIPRFLGNSELGVLAKLMSYNDIGQVNFTTTEKATTDRVLTLWDSEGRFPRKGDEMLEFSRKLPTHTKTGYYSNLYTQQDVPQHMDAENKAGLQIVKKLMDNIGNTPEGSQLINDFFDSFTANIQESFNEAAERIGVEIDNKGNIQYEGDNVKMDTNKFIDLIKDELTRRGLDSNYRKYAEINPETGLPYMPAWTNLVRTKLESIVNSVFTNRVTRQTLKGFHASQVASIGLNSAEDYDGNKGQGQSKFEEKTGFKLGRKLRYHPDGTQEMEVLLPKWMVNSYNTYDDKGNLIHEVTIEDLKDAGLDLMIGYRIPTEGKQSIALMRVVGLLDETQGSTIVVPDEWVLQTGADFDIDSVYGIVHTAYFDKNGKPHKVEYIEGDDEVDTFRRYVGYVNRLVDKATKKATSSEFTKEEFKEARRVAREQVLEENEEYDEFLSQQVSDKIEETNEPWLKLPREVKERLTPIFKNKSLKFADRVDAVVSIMSFYETGLNDEDVNQFAQQYRDIQATIKEQREFYQNVKDNAEQLAIDYANETRRERVLNAITARANIAGAMSLEEFSKLTIAQQNSRDARNNKIVDTFISIMNLPDAIGENLSSSNFEDIKAAKKNILKIMGYSSAEYRNINSIVSQSWYRDANMSGARLKAISVNRDNFCSISNIARTVIHGEFEGFKFKYTYPSEAAAKKQLTVLRKRFGKENVIREGDTIRINFNRLGWSTDNLNIDNRLITPYSSETTALILDGVKEGGVPNVDLYTFDVYKSIIDCGSNYETSIAFINQPIITELIARQNANDNVFGASGFNPLIGLKTELYKTIAELKGRASRKNNNLSVIKDSIKDLNIDEDEYIKEGMNLDDLKRHLNDIQFTSIEDFINNTLPSNRESFIEELIHSIKVLRAFEYFKQISDNINSNMMVITSDKFGAGQSVNEIDNVIKRIKDLKRKNTRSITTTAPRLMSAKGPKFNTLIDAVYPIIDFNNIQDIQNDKSESAYPSLYYQLKYSCLATRSIIRDSGIFKTQTDNFRNLVKAFGIDNLKTIQNLESFIVNMSQAQSPFVNTNSFKYDSDNQFIPSYNLNVISSQRDTRARLYGYTDVVGKFDITNMSEENVRRFMELSPANKVAIMQSNTSDNNLFKILNVEYRGRRNNYDKITIADSTISTESQYQMFRNIWFNDNPFVKLTAMDLVRYGIVVEGYKFKGGTISKIIPVELLYNSEDRDGTNIITDSDKAINNLIGYGTESILSEKVMNNEDTVEEMKEIFYRSNPSSPDIYTFENRRYKNSPKITFNSLGYATLKLADARVRNIVTGEGDNLVYKEYIKTGNNSGIETLYKVEEDGAFVNLIPLNKLEPNEIAITSINPDNNIYLPSNSLSALARNNANPRTIVTVKNALDENLRKLLVMKEAFVNEEYADIIRAYGEEVEMISSPVKESFKPNSQKRYIIRMSNEVDIIHAMDKLEQFGITNYIVIAPNIVDGVRQAINKRNTIDLANYKEQLSNSKLNGNEVQLRTKRSDNSESPYYTQLKASVEQTLEDVKVNGIAFVPVLQTVIDNTGFRAGGYVRYTKGRTNYILTNLGRVTSKSVKLTKDYLLSRTETKEGSMNLIYPRRDAIQQVVKENARLDKFATNNIVRVQTEKSFLENDVLESALVDNDREINEYISRIIESVERNNANVEEDALNDAFRSFAVLDLRSNTINKLNDNTREQALKVINGYTSRRIDDFLYMVNNFDVILDEKGQQLESLSITNKKLFDKMLTNESLRTRYEMFLDDIHRFINDYSIIDSIQPYDIDETISLAESQEEIDGLRRTNEVLKQLKAKFQRISTLDNTLKRSTKMYFDTYISSLTNDPRVKSGMMEITEAIEDENFFQYYLADSQETHIPIVQIVLKQMMKQLRQSEIDARDKRIEFTSKISKIIEDAKNAGLNVSMDDILDENGNLLLPYDQTLLDTLQDLKDELKLAQIEDENGRNGIIYKYAKNKLEKFLIDNVERQYVREMYQDYYDLDQILNKYPETYIKLKKLMQEESEILSTMTDNDYNTLTPQNARRLEVILDTIQNMRSPIDSDGNYKENYYEANAVNNYFARRRQLNNKYKITQPKEAYEERLRQALEDLKYPTESDTYKEAAEWLKSNTVHRLKGEFVDALNAAYKQTRRGNPFDYYLTTMSRGKRDADGVIDGRKFTEEQIANIKNHEEQALIAAKNRIKPDEADALRWINDRVEWVNTSYYEQAYVTANSLGKEAFEEWYKANHVFNPLTNAYEPLMIWRRRIIKDEANHMEYSPKSKWLETKVKPEYENPNYNSDVLTPSTNRYRNDRYYNMNEYQSKLYSEVSNLLNGLVKDKRSRAYINKGYLPSQAIEPEKQGFQDYWNDFKRSHGWYDTPNKSDIELNLYKKQTNAPMLHTLAETKLIPYREQMEGETKQEYLKYMQETMAQNKEIRAIRDKENKERNNPNVVERLNSFIDQMYLFNSRNDAARLAKITINQLRNMDFVKRAPNDKLLENRMLSRITGTEQLRTSKNENSNIAKHFENQVRKIIFNEFELDEGTKSKVSRVLRNMVSSKFMMLNVTGGIANVLYGKTQIQMEMAASRYFRYSDFRKGENEWFQGVGSYLADAYNETTNNETNAIIRLFNVIESDMATETYGKGNNPVGKLEDMLFIQQSAGEHYMQNATLLAMLYSHKVYTDDNGKTSIISYDTYSQNLRETSMLKVLNKTNPDLVSQYEAYKESIKKNYKVKEQFNKFKQDIVTNFLRSQSKELRAKFIEQYKEDSKNQREEFDALPSFRDQLELKNGIAVLKEGSGLTNGDIADFRNKVITVNHLIHGIYDKIGANVLQQSWWGALLMQFHKHLVPGFQKRFGYRLGHFDGVYNETRETVNKGTYISLGEFISFPIRKYYELNDNNELEAIRTLQGIGKAYLDFFGNMIAYYNILPEYDKANIRRTLGEWIAITKAVALFVVGKLLLDEDDESTQIADYILYSADRLMSETIQYSPWGMANEIQKLYSQPVAAFSIGADNLKLLEACCSYIFTGDKEDLIYQSGTYAGENKLKVNLLKQVPVVNQVRKHERLGANNSYYKVRSSPFSGLGQFIANRITGEEED